jgi:hypothetical protein
MRCRLGWIGEGGTSVLAPPPTRTVPPGQALSVEAAVAGPAGPGTVWTMSERLRAGSPPDSSTPARAPRTAGAQPAAATASAEARTRAWRLVTSVHR